LRVARLSEVVKVDSKGRVTIPQAIREALGVEPGMLMALIADFDKREIVLSPIATRTEAIYEFDVNLVDRPGALAAVTSVLAKHKADIIASKCASIARGEEASCTLIVDMSVADIDADTIRKELEGLDVVLQVKMRKFETRY